VFQTEKLLKDQADKVQPDDKEKMDAALKELKDALAGTDIDAVKRGHESLVNASQDFAQRLYAQAQASQSRAQVLADRAAAILFFVALGAGIIEELPGQTITAYYTAKLGRLRALLEE